MALFSLGSTHISHLVICCQYQAKSIRSTSTLSRCSVLDPLLFILYTSPLRSLIYLIRPSNIISMPMTLISSSLFLPSTSRSTSLISRLALTMYQLGCQQTCLLINLKLNSCSLVFLNIFPKFLILLFLCSLTLTNSARNLGVIFDSSLTFLEHISSMGGGDGGQGGHVPPNF